MRSGPSVVTVGGERILTTEVRQRLADQGLRLVDWHRYLSPPGQVEAPVLALVASSSDCLQKHFEELGKLLRIHGSVPAVALVADSSEQSVLAALRAGVADYLRCPFALDELIVRVNLVIASKCVASPEPATIPSDRPLVGGHQMVGSSPSVRRIKDYIGKVSETSSNVLITGETGTGKELVAELIHRNSSRRDRPFVCVNCAAMPESLIESELFGHHRGAFTGADVTVEGKLKSAHRGTVFFDEIGDMSLVAQAKVLRVIESKMVTPLGSHTSAPSDFRVIAATNRNLESMIQIGDFRRDLYFRLNVVRFHLPPLRERKEDIVQLLNHHISELNRTSGCAVEGFTRPALEAMLNYHWPGNVRELRNVVEAVLVTCRRGYISPSDIPSIFWHQITKSGESPGEADVLLAALFQTNWNISRAAEMLHWSRMTIYRKMEKYAISKAAQRGDSARPHNNNHGQLHNQQFA